jgi:hypothetical protein
MPICDGYAGQLVQLSKEMAGDVAYRAVMTRAQGWRNMGPVGVAVKPTHCMCPRRTWRAGYTSWQGMWRWEQSRRHLLPGCLLDRLQHAQPRNAQVFCAANLEWPGLQVPFICPLFTALLRAKFQMLIIAANQRVGKQVHKHRLTAFVADAGCGEDTLVERAHRIPTRTGSPGGKPFGTACIST